MAGILINAKSIRIEPPLTITREQQDQVIERLAATLEEVNKIAVELK